MSLNLPTGTISPPRIVGLTTFTDSLTTFTDGARQMSTKSLGLLSAGQGYRVCRRSVDLEPRISKRTTIVDVAQVAGVSVKTASRALNDAPHVSAAVRRKVKEAASALDYHPNIAAQSLIARRSFLIGLTYERPSPSYVVELQNGALNRLENARYRLLVLPFSDVARRPAELGSLLLRAGIDGALLAPPACDQPVLLDMLERHRLAYARITPHHDLARGLVVVMDEAAAGYAIAAHILQLGHRRVGIIMGDPSHAASAARMQGYRRAFAEAGVSIDDNWVVTGDFTYDLGYSVASRLLQCTPPPTAVLAQNDDMAVAAMAAARDAGLSIPADVSIAGFDDSEISRTAWPQLTTIRQPVYEMVWDATDRLVAQIEGSPHVSPIRRQDYPHQLVIRASSAPPRS